MVLTFTCLFQTSTQAVYKCNRKYLPLDHVKNCAYLKSEPTLFPFSGIPGSGHVSDAIASPPWVTAKVKENVLDMQL